MSLPLQFTKQEADDQIQNSTEHWKQSIEETIIVKFSSCIQTCGEVKCFMAVKV